jgi:hypothetical protein
MDNFGAWKVAWTEASSTGNVMAARFSSTGTRIGSVIRVATTARNEYDPSIAANSAGDFVISYSSDAVNNPNVLAKVYSSGGTLLRTLNVANTASRERRPSAAWTTGSSNTIAIAYEFNEDIRLKRYSAGGTLLGTSIIASGSAGQIRPSAAMDNFGRTVVVWQERVNDQWDMFARTVSGAGQLSARFTIGNSISNETNAAVAIGRSSGRFVVAFEVGTDVFARELTVAGAPLSSALLVASTGTGSALPAISINNSNTYFITFTALNRPSDAGEGIFGRRGSL